MRVEKIINTFLMLSIFVLVGFLFDSVRTEYVFPGVLVAGESMSRHYQDRVIDDIDSFEGFIFQEPIDLVVGDHTYETTLDEIGISLDKNELRQRIMAFGHQETTLQRFVVWVQSFFIKHSLDIHDTIVFDEYTLLNFLTEDNIDDSDIRPPFEGEIRIDGSGIFASAPRKGFGIDYAHLQSRVLDIVARTSSDRTLVLELSPLLPHISDQEFENFRQHISEYIDDGFVIAVKGIPVLQYTREDLLSLLQVEKVGYGWYMRIPQEQQTSFFKGLLARDAEFTITDDYRVEIIPSEKGFLFDQEDLIHRVYEAFDTGNHRLTLISDGTSDPEITTEDLEELNITHVISQFTTHFKCCESRVTNIRRIAQIVDGTLVMPGESFELNEAVGKRTLEKGFVHAGALMFGEHVDHVGGGVSQFATTLYNSVYWGGLWIVAHKPHSQYFSRYPEGVEATVSWKYPILKFTNDYTTPILIKTSTTETSVTVTLLGNNDGRVIIGDHEKGSTDIQTPATGGDKSRLVVSSVSSRHNIKPAPIKYVAYPQRYAPGTERIAELGRDGWTVDVQRTVVYQDIGLVHTDEWKVDYVHPTIVHVAQCAEVDSIGAPCVTAQ